MKKKKMLVRVAAAILITVMVIGLIVPAISATEVSSEHSLPDGFEFVQDGNFTYVRKSEDNVKPALILDRIPDGFDTSVVTVFIGNLETYECKSVDLYYEYHYVASLDLEDGYYVVFGGDFAWSDSKGKTYVLNDGEYKYLYVGDNYNEKLYGVSFEQDDAVVSMYMSLASRDAQAVEHNHGLTIENANVVFPDSAKLEKIVIDEVENETNPRNDENVSSLDKTSDDENNTSAVGMLIDGLKKSVFLIIAIAICYVGATVLRLKREAALARQTEEDKYDERRIE